GSNGARHPERQLPAHTTAARRKEFLGIRPVGREGSGWGLGLALGFTLEAGGRDFLVLQFSFEQLVGGGMRGTARLPDHGRCIHDPEGVRAAFGARMRACDFPEKNNTFVVALETAEFHDARGRFAARPAMALSQMIFPFAFLGRKAAFETRVAAPALHDLAPPSNFESSLPIAILRSAMPEDTSACKTVWIAMCLRCARTSATANRIRMANKT